MSTNNKKYTFLLTTNKSHKTHSLSLSQPALQLISGILIFLLVLLVAFLVDYFSLLLSFSHHKKLKEENIVLKYQIANIESHLSKLEVALGKTQIYTEKLKLISQIDTNNRGLQLSLKERVDGSVDFEKHRKRFISIPPADVFSRAMFAEETKDLYSEYILRLSRNLQKAKLVEYNALNLYETLWDKMEFLASTPSILPVKGWMSSHFGYRRHPITLRIQMHKGVDIVAPVGSSILAPADGVVSYTGYDLAYGKVVVIDHGHGVTTRYAHNSQIFVKVGQEVKRWFVIAALGNTGASTGPHLHYEVRVNGIPVDPIHYILDF